MDSLSLQSQDSDELLLLHHPTDVGAPLLKQSGRKLRHILGITLRNLTLKSPEYAERRASLARFSRRESLDSGDGSGRNSTDGGEEKDTVDSSISHDSPRRRSTGRRRSTLSQPSLIGMEIEKTLTDLNQDQLLDSVFAIYSPRQLQPIYISEMAHKSMNPEFREIDFSDLYCRNDSYLTLSVWVKTTTASSRWSHLFTEPIDLSTLIFIGKSTDVIRYAFPPNSFIVHLEDGCYVHQSSDRVKPDFKSLSLSPGSTSPSNENGSKVTFESTTCSFDVIMKLNNLEECIYDSEQTIKLVSKQLQARLDPQGFYIQSKKKSQLENMLAHTKKHAQSEQSKSKQLKRQIDTLRRNIEQRRSTIKTQESLKEGLEKEKEKRLQDLVTQKDQLEVQKQCISVELSRIAQQLQVIFPICPISTPKSFEFSICGLAMPYDFKYSRFDENEIGAAYGFAAQLVFFLSEYLSVPLRYPIQPYGSNSFIIDPISTIQGSRTFPLWIKGSLFYRFEYGVYLFHKNMEQLINSQRLAVADLSQTLANLKNLLLVLSSS